MAIFKPTDCSPFNGTFDVSQNSADLPIIFECKVDTSNTIVTGYSIEIYDSNNELVFPSGNREIGPVSSNITYLSDLRPYVINNFSSLIPNMRNVNSGLNGTYLEIPFYVDSIDTTSGSTVSRNQMSSGLTEGQTYTWKITLYQEVRKGNNVDDVANPPVDNSIFPPKEERYYDMTVASGTVIGSTEKRIQTALIDSDDRVVDNLVLVDKFIQPVQIYGLSNYHEDPVKWQQGDPEELFPFVAARSLITGYDSTYGYIYPSTAADNAFVKGQITADTASGFQIYKNGNNLSNLGATDMVEFVYDNEDLKGNVVWKESIAKPELSYWEQTYFEPTNPNGVYSPLLGDFSSYTVSAGERIIFNNIQKSKVVFSDKYYGSPYNGIFKPSFSSKKVETSFETSSGERVIPAGLYLIKENPTMTNLSCNISFSSFCPDESIQDNYTYSSIGITSSGISYIGDDVGTIPVYSGNKWVNEKCRYISIPSDIMVSSDIALGHFYNWLQNNAEIDTYEVTVQWLRTTDASNWGTLSNKIVYCRQDSKNYEVNTNTQVGEINKTPFKFVEEEPVKIFNTVEQVSETQVAPSIGNNRYVFYINRKISVLSSVVLENGVDITKDCSFEVKGSAVIYAPSAAQSTSPVATISYIPYDKRDYTGVIFYNQKALSGVPGYLYIRPSININKNMIFKELTTTGNFTWFNINSFNKDYNYIKYKLGDGNLNQNSTFNPIPDKTRYQIKSFYKDSDYNPFSIYKNPTIVSTISGNVIESDGFENNIITRNFTVVSTYDQNNYIQWKSYQWFLYDSAKRTILEKTDEQYDGEITATFYGLDPQKYYILSLVLQTNTGKIIEIDYVLYTDFTESAEQKDLVEAEFDCDTLAMKANLKLVNTVLAPDADEYLSGSTASTKDTAYYYDQDNFYKKDGEVIASIDSETGILKITGQNALNYSKSFSDYAIDSSTRTGSIQTNSDEIVLEGSFQFSEDYNGNIFSISRDDNTNATVEISIPQAIQNIDSEGFVNLANDIDKIKIKNGSYLKVVDESGNLSSTWQDSSSFHNTSIWKKADQVLEDHINVANFKYAEVDFVNEDSVPYPYTTEEDQKVLETTTGESIIWNQKLENVYEDFKSTETDTKSFVDLYIQQADSPYTLLASQEIRETGKVNIIFPADSVNLNDPPKTINFNGTARIRHNGSTTDIPMAWFDVKEGHKYYFTANFTGVNPTTSGGISYNRAQVFDLTLMFGEGKEPTTAKNFWSYFDTNKIYLKNTYRNINGPYNSYDIGSPLKDPTNPKEQLFSIKPKDGDTFRCNKTEENPDGDEFNIDQPDRLIWLDYAPTQNQMKVVVNADQNSVSTQSMTVMEDELLIWNDDSFWKDGVYIESGYKKTLIGQIAVNGVVAKSDYLDEITPTYSSSGLTQQEEVPQNINERKAIADYEFSFRIFINTNNFSVDQLRSRCYVGYAPGPVETYDITTNLTNVTADASNPTTITSRQISTLKFIADSGYTLPDTVTATNCSFKWNKDSGQLILSNATGNVEITISADKQMPKLDTPQNVSITGSVLSWDAVEHAERYQITATDASGNAIILGTATGIAAT